jgi:hypothetical protein
MRKLFLSAAVAALLAACAPPASQDTNERPDAPPTVEACNSVTPDVTRQVVIGEEVVTAAAAADLRGGAITPGVYDLASASRIGSPTGWSGTRAVALQVSEDAGGVMFNWAGASPQGQTDAWTAAFIEAPTPTITFTCGRMGTVDVDFAAEDNTLQLRIADGANGALQLNFVRRG